MVVQNKVVCPDIIYIHERPNRLSSLYLNIYVPRNINLYAIIITKEKEITNLRCSKYGE